MTDVARAICEKVGSGGHRWGKNCGSCQEIERILAASSEQTSALRAALRQEHENTLASPLSDARLAYGAEHGCGVCALLAP